MTNSHLLSDFLGVGSQWFVQQSGPGLGKLTSFRQGRGLVIFSLTVTRIVDGGVVVGFRFPFQFLRSSRFLPKGSSGAFRPLFAHSWQLEDRFCSACHLFPSKDRCGKTQEVRVSLCGVTPDRAARRQRDLGLVSRDVKVVPRTGTQECWRQESIWGSRRRDETGADRVDMQ